MGLTKDGSGAHLFTGRQWAQLFAIQWIHGLIWIFGNMALAIAVSPDILGLPFAFTLICNIIGGFSYDYADTSFIEFYQIFPFNWSIQLMRRTVYGSFSSRLVAIAVGSICGEAAFFFLLFAFVSYRHANHASRSMNTHAKAYDEGIELVVVNDKEVE